MTPSVGPCLDHKYEMLELNWTKLI